MTLTDEEREQRIKALATLSEKAHDLGLPGEAMAIWREMCAEIKRRSPDQVRRMEVERGLV